MSDLDLIAAIFKAHPDIVGVRKREADQYIARDTWIIWLSGSWRADDVGHGDTLEEAYHNALASRAKLPVAA